MHKFFAATLLFSTVLAQAQKSPHESTEATIGGDHISISYGRPYLKGRHVGNEVAPYGRVWRLGADEATLLKTDAAIDLGGLSVPAGSYALFAMPTNKGWKLIVNKVAQQWGLDYSKNKAEDLGSVDLNVSRGGQPVEQFTMVLESTGPKTGKLKFMWDTTTCDVPIVVK
jgi:hypothetical protein